MGHLANAHEFHVGKSRNWEYFKMHRFSFDKIEKVLFLVEIKKYIKAEITKVEYALKYKFIFNFFLIQIYNKKLFIKIVVFSGVMDQFKRRLKYESKSTPFAINVILLNKRITARKNLNMKRRSKGLHMLKPKKFKIGMLSLRKRSSLFIFCLIDILNYVKHLKIRLSDNYQYKIFKKSFKYWTENLVIWNLSNFFTKKLSFSIRKYLSYNNLDTCRANFTFVPYKSLTSACFIRYIIKRIIKGEYIKRLIYFLIKHIRKETSIIGFFLKIKGRTSKKPRARFNKHIFKYGKVKFSTVKSKIDYAMGRYESKWGTCSIKLWKVLK